MNLKLITILIVAMFGWSVSLFAQVPPTLLSPQNLDSCQSISLNLQWQSVPNAVSYRVEISDTVNFERIIITQPNINVTTLNVTLNDWEKRYYWRVYSVFPGGTEGKSTEWSFKTKKTPVVLVSIPNGITCVDTNVRFVWRKADAEFYAIQIARDTLFQNIYFSKNNLTDTSVSVSIPLYNEKMYWRVASIKAQCQTDWSIRREFTTKQESPTLLEPANGSKGTEIFGAAPFTTRLKWNSVAGASAYDIQISDSPLFETFYTQASVPDTTYVLNLGSNYDSLFYWRVRSYVNDCRSYWSEPFTVRTPYNVSTPTLPLDNEICVSMNDNLIKWTVIPGVTKYSIEISTDSNFVDNSLIVKDISEIQTSVELTDALTDYFWRVRGEDGNNVGLWSEVFKFTTTQRAPSTFKPLDNSFGSAKELRLEWEDFGTNTYYDLKLATDMEMDNLLIDTTLLDTNFFNIIVSDNNKTYYWMVRVRTGACLGDWSKVLQFKTIINYPQLISPENESIVESIYPIFNWENINDATAYEIEVSLDSNFTKLYKFNRNIELNTMTFAGEKFEEKTTYYWRIRAKNNEGKSLWSPFFFFTIREQAVDAPTLVSPANGTIKLPLELTMLWNVKPNAATYDLEVATDNQFKNIVISQNTADTSYNAVGLDLFTNYFWRVRSINNGGAGNWSSAYSFRTKDEAPTGIVILTYPDNKAESLPTTFTFTWESVERSLYYQLLIANKESFEESSIEFDYEKVFDLNKKIFGLEYNKEYFWKVRAINEDGNGPWSVVRSFKTLDITSVEDNDPYLSEVSVSPNPSNGFANFKFDLKKDEKVKLSIHNLLGKELYNSEFKNYNRGQNTISVNLNDFNPGVYIYNLQVGNNSYNGTIVVK